MLMMCNANVKKPGSTKKTWDDLYPERAAVGWSPNNLKKNSFFREIFTVFKYLMISKDRQNTFWKLY